MHLYDPEFLFAFLPVFIGLYALIPSSKRPVLISLGNLFFLLKAGKYGLIGFLILFCSAYFSGISIYNLRNVPEKEIIRRKLLGANVALYAAVFIFFAVSGTGGMERLIFSPSSVYFMAVVPLNLISYLFDVYRGDCEAQTRLSSLAAYSAFFPSASFGPVLKYKNYVESFKAPKLSMKKLSSGIKLYIVGLAEYLIIARRLEAIRTEILSAPNSLRSGIGWLFVPLFFLMFVMSIQGLIHMGRGVSLMLGFYIRPASRRAFFTETFQKRVDQMNEHLSSWVKDYVYTPLKQSAGKESTALLGSVCVGALWYSLSVGWLFTGVVVAGLIALQADLYKKRIMLSKTAKGLITKLFMVVAVAFCAFMELSSAGMNLFDTSVSTDSTFLNHLLSEAAVPIVLGLLFSGTLLRELVRRMNNIWLRVLVPVVEMLLLVVSISFMLNIV